MGLCGLFQNSYQLLSPQWMGGEQVALGGTALLCSLLVCQEQMSLVRDQGSLRGRLGHRECTLQAVRVKDTDG